MSLEDRLSFYEMNLGVRKLKGAEIAFLALMYKDLRETGNITTPLFGVPGGANLDFNDTFAMANAVIGAYNNLRGNPFPENPFAKTLWDVLSYSRLRGVTLNEYKVVHTRTEEIAGLAGKAYGQATGRTGVIFGTSGPGATNLLTALGEGWADSSPVLAFLGQTPSTSSGRMFQEGYALEMSRPTTKYSASIRDPRKIAEEIFKANYIAKAGRPGAVAIELPVDIAKAVIECDLAEFDILFEREYLPRDNFPSLIHTAQTLEEAVGVINSASNPIFLAGGGVITANASPELFRVATKNRVPVLTTLMALGAFPSNHWLCAHMPGTHGAEYANEALYAADVVIAVGARLENRVITNVGEFLANGKKVIQIDIDKNELGRNVTVMPVWGDVKDVLRYLIENVNPKNDFSSWHRQIEKWKREGPITYDRETDELLAAYVTDTAFKLIPQTAVVTAGVGAHQMLVSNHGHHLHPRTRGQSGGFGTMGYGLPAAIAYALATGKETWNLDGDGSFIMTEQALGTLAEYNIPVKTVIVANGFRIVGQWQDFMYGQRKFGSVFKIPDFAKLAEAYGIEGINITKKSGVRNALEYVAAHPGPIVAAFYTSPDEILYPWIPGKEGLSGMIRNPLNIRNR